MRNKFHNYIENILSFYSTFFTKGYYLSRFAQNVTELRAKRN